MERRVARRAPVQDPAAALRTLRWDLAFELLEPAAYGAALLAGVGAGAWHSVDEACDSVVRIKSAMAPNPEAVETLEHQYRRFRAVYPALRPLYE